MPKLLCFYYNQYDKVSSYGPTIQKMVIGLCSNIFSHMLFIIT